VVLCRQVPLETGNFWGGPGEASSLSKQRSQFEHALSFLAAEFFSRRVIWWVSPFGYRMSFTHPSELQDCRKRRSPSCQPVQKMRTTRRRLHCRIMLGGVTCIARVCCEYLRTSGALPRTEQATPYVPVPCPFSHSRLRMSTILCLLRRTVSPMNYHQRLPRLPHATALPLPSPVAGLFGDLSSELYLICEHFSFHCFRCRCQVCLCPGSHLGAI